MAIADLLRVAGLPSSIGVPLSVGGGGPSGAASSGNYITPAFDSSRWTVSTGGGSASSSEAVGTLASASAGGGLPWVMLAIAALVGVVLWKKL